MANVENLSTAAADVIAERCRQIEAEGWSAEHDDEHRDGELGYAAICYIRPVVTGSELAFSDLPPTKEALKERARRFKLPPHPWPWAAKRWKPGNRRRNLVKAGALILAEIERLDRLAAPASSPESGGQP